MPHPEIQPLSAAAVKAALAEDALLLDTRDASTFINGFVPGALFIGQGPRFAEWAAALLAPEQKLILLTDAGKEQIMADELQRLGIHQIEGYLQGGFEAWQAAGEPIDLVIEVEADELAMDLPFDENLLVLDVRKPAEWAEGHVKDARHVPLEELLDTANIADIEEEQNVYIHCASGYRSVIAASMMKRQGLHNVRHVAGGWKSISEQKNIETEKDPSALN